MPAVRQLYISVTLVAILLVGSFGHGTLGRPAPQPVQADHGPVVQRQAQRQAEDQEQTAAPQDPLPEAQPQTLEPSATADGQSAAAQPLSAPTSPVEPAPSTGPAPLADPLIDPAAAHLEPLRDDLNRYLGQQPGAYGLALVDLTSGAQIGIQQDRLFLAASTYKLPMAMFVLDEVARGQASLDETVTYTADDWQGGTGVLQDEIAEGDAVTIGRLVELAITESDNVATEMLRRRFTREAILDYMRRFGATQLQYDALNYGATPRDMARYLAALYRQEGIADPLLSEFLGDLLARTVWDDRIAAGIPDGVTVAHKIGTLPGVVNDAALVLHPLRPYVLTFYSEGVEDAAGCAVAAEVSRRVYAFLSALPAAG